MVARDDDRHRPRVLLVADSLVGGMGAAVTGGAAWLSAHGWDVRVAAPAEAGSSSSNPFDVVAIPESLRDAAAALAAGRDLRALAGTWRPDVVHCHGARSFAIARVLARLPSFLTLHGSGPSATDPLGYGLVRRGGVRLLPALAVAAFTADPGGPPGFRFAPHASPRLAELDRSPFGAAAAVPTFLWLGRLVDQKRPEVFLDALALAATRVELQGVVAGDGPLGPELRALAGRTGAPVRFLGHCDDVAGLLREAWAVVMVSRFEALTFAVQEAMWAGRAAIASRLPGHEWLLGDQGLVGDTPEDLARAMERMSERGVAAASGEAAAARIRRLLTPHAPWPTVEAAYARRLRRDRGSRPPASN